MGFEHFVSALKISFFILAGLAFTVFAQRPFDQMRSFRLKPNRLGVVVPVPKEIFRSLDEFRGANWHVVQRPEVAGWKSHGDQVQIAILLGVEIGEGFIAMEGEDSTEVKDLGNTVLKLARGRGRESALRRSRTSWMAERMSDGTQ